MEADREPEGRGSRWTPVTYIGACSPDGRMPAPGGYGLGVRRILIHSDNAVRQWYAEDPRANAAHLVAEDEAGRVVIRRAMAAGGEACNTWFLMFRGRDGEARAHNIEVMAELGLVSKATLDELEAIERPPETRERDASRIRRSERLTAAQDRKWWGDRTFGAELLGSARENLLDPARRLASENLWVLVAVAVGVAVLVIKR